VSEAAFELHSSRRGGFGQPVDGQYAFNCFGRTAVPTGEAHRLPKKCAFLSVENAEVKAACSKNKAAAEPLRTFTNGNEIVAYKSGKSRSRHFRVFCKTSEIGRYLSLAGIRYPSPFSK
jgi:hypothetical protein